MIRRRIQIVLSLALGVGALGFPLPLGVANANACGTYVDGVCVYPPDPVIVDPGTGPVMLDGLFEKLDLTITQADNMASSVITDTAGVATPTDSGTSTLTTTDFGVVQADSPSQGDSHNYGSCYAQANCTNLKLWEPTYSAPFDPHGDFKATGYAAWSWLAPSVSSPQQFWTWVEHSNITNKGSSLCILTNSVEMTGNNLTLEDWQPGGSVFYNSNTTVNFNVSDTWNGAGVQAGGSFNLYKGEQVGEIYNSGHGYVASWRAQNGDCVNYNDTAELKDGAIWAQPWGDAANVSWKVATAVWYNKS